MSNVDRKIIPLQNKSGLEDVVARLEHLEEYMSLFTSREIAKVDHEKNTRRVWYVRFRSTFEKLQQYMDELMTKYDDVAERIQYAGLIKDLVATLKNQVDPALYPYERKVCIMLHDSIHKARVENVTKEQAEVWADVLQILLRGETDKEQYMNISRMLRHNGLSWIVGDI